MPVLIQTTQHFNSIGDDVPSLPLFNVDDYGAVGDGVTDDYEAIRDAWNAMLTAANGGLLYFPRPVTYRINLGTGSRVAASDDDAYAAFPLPMISSEGPTKKAYGVLGVGAPYSVRAASSFGSEGDAKQVATASILKVDYSTPFAWSGSLGHPSVFGAPDADATGHTTDNIVTNLHFIIDGLIVRQPDNPSLANFNLELCSTVEVRSLRCDVEPVLDDISEPTHPTGCALLAPKSNNNVAVLIDQFVAEGYYAGLPYTEHVDVRSAIVLSCRIGVHNRRACSHFGTMHMLKMEQNPYGLAGYDPAGTAPNLGVIAWRGGTVIIDFYDAEDYAYNGARPWIYTPTAGSHIYAPDGGLAGQIRYQRVNSEPTTGGGIGVSPTGVNGDIYVNGNTDSGLGISGFAIYGYTGEAITIGGGHRHLGNVPTNPPNTPTIGTATAGDTQASITFTPSGSGATATSYTMTSTPGGLTASGSSSPIVVTGLTNSTSYTFKVKANNAGGSSAESSASNSVTPTAGAAPNAPTIGTATGGNASASITFTPAGSGGTPTSFRAISTPGSITGTASSSPVTVSGLTNGTSYTFTVRAQNGTGNSSESSSSNSVTPAAPSLPADTFTRTASSLGTSSSGHTWLGDPNSQWTTDGSKAINASGGTSHDPAWIASAGSNITVTATVGLDSAREGGLIARVTDASNYLYMDLSRTGSTTVNARFYNRISGTFTGLGSATSVTWNEANTATVSMTISGTSVSGVCNGTSISSVTFDSGLTGTGAGIQRLAEIMSYDDFAVS